jgi:hypothetical protein
MLPSRQLLLRCAALTSIALAASSCGSLLDPKGPPVSVSFTVMTTSAASSTLDATIGNRRILLSVPEGVTSPATGQIRGTGYGDAAVQFTLLGVGGDTLAAVSFTQTLRAGNRYGIGVVVGSQRPLSVCGATRAAAPLRNSASDSLFVLTAELPDGAVC